MTYLKPELLILVPFLIGFGEFIKPRLKKLSVPFVLLLSAIIIATVYGLIVSKLSGWKYILDAVVVIGVLHGSVAAFSAMGLYDTVRKK